jgi:hypothetical protein
LANLRPLKDWNHEAEPHIKEKGLWRFFRSMGVLPMQRFTHASHLTNLNLWLWLALVFTSCEDSFMKQATANKMGAVANLQTTIDSEGNFVAQIDPTKAETQLMRITEGAIAGAAVAIPPSALSIPVSIMVGEGVALTTNSFSKDLGLTGNALTAGGPSVSFTASQDVVASNPLTLSIPFGALSFALAEVDTDNLVVMYRWMTLKDGEPSYEVGVIPGDKVTRGQSKVSFQTTKFGTFQVGISETKITKPILAATEEPPALKSCERYAAAAFPSCTQDGQVGCVTTESFKAADLSLAKSEFILAGKTMASVTGNVTLPDPGKVLTNTSYGAGGIEKSGTLTLPDPSKVLASSASYGNPASLTTPTLTDRGVWDLRTSFAGAGYYSSVTNMPNAVGIAGGATVLGLPIPAAPSLCSVDGAASCVVDGSNFKAAKLSDFGANDILSGKTIAGVSGAAPARPATCSSDGEMGCVVVGPNYAAAIVTGAAPKILFGSSVAGIQGTAASRPTDCSADGEFGCIVNGPDFAAAKVAGAAKKILQNFSVAGIEGAATLPPVGSVLATTRYGNPDSQNIGLMTLPYPDKVLAGSGVYGDPSTPVLPTLPSRGTLNLTDAFPGAGYYTDANNPPDATKIASGTRILGIDGSLTASAVSVEPWNLRAGVNVGGVVGNLRTNCRNSGNPLVYTTQPSVSATISNGTPLQIRFASASLASTYALGEQIFVKVLNGGSALSTNHFKIDRINNDTADILPINSGGYGTAVSNSQVAIYRFFVDPWDTIDDSLLSMNYQPMLPTGWSPLQQCGGIRNANNLDGQWIDMTFVNNSYTGCTAASCALLDTNSKLIWSRKSDTTSTTESWDAAKTFCQSDGSLMSYPGSTIFRWRIPTQKELMAAYVNGLNSTLAQTNLMDRAKTVWSSTNFTNTIGANASNAWTMHLATGQISNSSKGGNNNTLCVRELGTTMIPGTVMTVP